MSLTIFNIKVLYTKIEFFVNCLYINIVTKFIYYDS